MPETTTLPVGLESVLAQLRPVFARIAEGTIAREQDHLLPREQVRWLMDAGFAALRVPRDFGGSGLTIRELAIVLIELAAADANLPQIFRGHIAFVEDQLVAADSERRTTWLRRFVDGEIVGNAWSEVGSGALWKADTTVERTDDGWSLTGTKFYSTGSIYADWVDVLAHNHEDDTEAGVLVRTAQPAVSISDDWDGFGQQLTGTGTATFSAAVVDADEVHPLANRFRYQTGLYQLVLLTVLAGIAQAVERDAADAIRSRQRVYSQGNAALTREDPQVIAVAGEISSAAFVARATVLAAAEAVDRAADATATHRNDQPGAQPDAETQSAYIGAEIATAQAQVVLSRLVPDAATRLFDTLGASATSRAKGLDRHWRNARTVASHNPWLFKARTVGDWSVNHTAPQFDWSIGISPDAAGHATNP